jgi:hypothetical protein
MNTDEYIQRLSDPNFDINTPIEVDNVQPKTSAPKELDVDSYINNLSDPNFDINTAISKNIATQDKPKSIVPPTPQPIKQTQAPINQDMAQKLSFGMQPPQTAIEQPPVRSTAPSEFDVAGQPYIKERGIQSRDFVKTLASATKKKIINPVDGSEPTLPLTEKEDVAFNVVKKPFTRHFHNIYNALFTERPMSDEEYKAGKRISDLYGDGPALKEMMGVASRKDLDKKYNDRDSIIEAINRGNAKYEYTEKEAEAMKRGGVNSALAVGMSSLAAMLPELYLLKGQGQAAVVTDIAKSTIAKFGAKPVANLLEKLSPSVREGLNQYFVPAAKEVLSNGLTFAQIQAVQAMGSAPGEATQGEIIQRGLEGAKEGFIVGGIMGLGSIPAKMLPATATDALYKIINMSGQAGVGAGYTYATGGSLDESMANALMGVAFAGMSKKAEPTPAELARSVLKKQRSVDIVPEEGESILPKETSPNIVPDEGTVHVQPQIRIPTPEEVAVKPEEITVKPDNLPKIDTKPELTTQNRGVNQLRVVPDEGTVTVNKQPIEGVEIATQQKAEPRDVIEPMKEVQRGDVPAKETIVESPQKNAKTAEPPAAVVAKNAKDVLKLKGVEEYNPDPTAMPFHEAVSLSMAMSGSTPRTKKLDDGVLGEYSPKRDKIVLTEKIGAESSEMQKTAIVHEMVHQTKKLLDPEYAQEMTKRIGKTPLGRIFPESVASMTSVMKVIRNQFHDEMSNLKASKIKGGKRTTEHLEMPVWKEMLDVSEAMWGKSDPKNTKEYNYRTDPEELLANFGSLVMLDHNLASKIAPNAYNKLMEGINANHKMKTDWNTMVRSRFETSEKKVDATVGTQTKLASINKAIEKHTSSIAEAQKAKAQKTTFERFFGQVADKFPELRTINRTYNKMLEKATPEQLEKVAKRSSNMAKWSHHLATSVNVFKNNLQVQHATFLAGKVKEAAKIYKGTKYDKIVGESLYEPNSFKMKTDEWLIINRIANDKTITEEMVGPMGITKEVANQYMRDFDKKIEASKSELKEKLGKEPTELELEKYEPNAFYRRTGKEFLKQRQDNIVGMLTGENGIGYKDSFSPEMTELIKNRKDYVRFSHVDDKIINKFLDIEDNNNPLWEEGGNAAVKGLYQQETALKGQKYKGDLGAVADPMIETMYADIYMYGKKIANDSKRSFAEMMETLQDIQGKNIVSDRFMFLKAEKNGNVWKEPTNKNLELITWMKNGGEEGAWVDKNVAEGFATLTKTGIDLGALKTFGDVSRAAFITYNPKFAISNFLRDAMTSYINNPEYTSPIRPFWQGITAIPEAFRAVVDQGLQRAPNLRQATKESAFPYRISFEKPSGKFEKNIAKAAEINRFSPGETGLFSKEEVASWKDADKFHKSIMYEPPTKYNPLQATKRIFHAAVEISEMSRKLGDYKFLKEIGLSPIEINRRIHTQSGTPNTFQKGKMTEVLNLLFMFSNVAVQGNRGFAHALEQAPAKTLAKLALVQGASATAKIALATAAGKLFMQNQFENALSPLVEDEQKAKDMAKEGAEYFHDFARATAYIPGSQTFIPIKRTDRGTFFYINLKTEPTVAALGDGLKTVLASQILDDMDLGQSMASVFETINSINPYGKTSPFVQELSMLGAGLTGETYKRPFDGREVYSTTKRQPMTSPYKIRETVEESAKTLVGTGLPSQGIMALNDMFFEKVFGVKAKGLKPDQQLKLLKTLMPVYETPTIEQVERIRAEKVKAVEEKVRLENSSVGNKTAVANKDVMLEVGRLAADRTDYDELKNEDLKKIDELSKKLYDAGYVFVIKGKDKMEYPESMPVSNRFKTEWKDLNLEKLAGNIEVGNDDFKTQIHKQTLKFAKKQYQSETGATYYKLVKAKTRDDRKKWVDELRSGSLTPGLKRDILTALDEGKETTFNDLMETLNWSESDD